MTETRNSKAADNVDSKTLVHLRLHGGRTTMTVRILPELKEAFARRTRDLGLSTWHVTEGLISGWLYGLNEKVELVHQSPTINMTLVREVKRVRRYAVEEEVSEVVEAQKCVVCGKVAYAEAFSSSGSQFLCRRDLEKVRRRLTGWRVAGERRP